MKSSKDIIDALSAHFDGANDLAISRQTGIAQSVISMVRTGRRSLPPEDCVRAATALGIEPGALFLIAFGERQKNSKLRSSCMRMAKAALPIVAALGISVAPAPPIQPTTQGSLFIMSNRKRRVFRPRFGKTVEKPQPIQSLTSAAVAKLRETRTLHLPIKSTTEVPRD